MYSVYVSMWYKASAEVTAVGYMSVVESSVLRASTNISSCVSWEYMPGDHNPEVQANVKIKSLVKSMTHWLHSLSHVIDSNEYSLYMVFICGFVSVELPTAEFLMKIMLQCSSIYL